MLGKHNVEDAVDTVHYFKNMGYSIVVDFVSEEGRAIDNDLCISEYMKVYKMLRKDIEKIYISRDGCGVGNSMFFVTATGDICLCPSLRDSSFVFTKLNENFSLKKILNCISKKYSSLYCAHDCSVKNICNGGCRARAYKKNASLYAAYEPYCKIYEGK